MCTNYTASLTVRDQRHRNSHNFRPFGNLVAVVLPRLTLHEQQSMRGFLRIPTVCLFVTSTATAWIALSSPRSTRSIIYSSPQRQAAKDLDCNQLPSRSRGLYMMWPFGGGEGAKSKGKASAGGWSSTAFLKQQQQQLDTNWEELESQLRRQETSDERVRFEQVSRQLGSLAGSVMLL